ncbi:hypothetical protein PHLCEN_2v9573 [Hermanssonia centrifuga]|uniref:Uncharacterized protein n=1 Tax=Hermanssonia centrifuga TaxID=98765 RepID=A0A2R6NQG5_9APHY|nr:hypothetical protein PHLCEN_2v9573 [Hermanssonia centrifuga]
MADWVLFSAPFLGENKRDVLLQRMTDAARISLDNTYLNCGCYHDLPWIKSLLELDHSDFGTIRPQSLSSLFDILDQFKFINTSSSTPLEYSDLLDESGRVVAVITGEGVKEDYEKAKVNIRRYFDEVNYDRSINRGTDDLATDDGDVGEGVIGMVADHIYPCNTTSDNGPREGTDQKQGDVGAVNRVSDAIIVSSESEPAHGEGRTQAVASNGELVPADIGPLNAHPPTSHAIHPPVSTDDRTFDLPNPLFGHLERVGSVSEQGEEIGINAEEGIEEGSKRGLGRDSNGSQIEMQKTTSDDVH